jgi:hypothetical protein
MGGSNRIGRNAKRRSTKSNGVGVATIAGRAATDENRDYFAP